MPYTKIQSRGQVITLDVLLSVIIFISSLLTTMWLYGYIVRQADAMLVGDQLAIIGPMVVGHYLSDTGFPTQWSADPLRLSTSQTQHIGLSTGMPLVISPAKIINVSLAQSSNGTLLLFQQGLRARGFSYYLQVYANSSNFTSPFLSSGTFLTTSDRTGVYTFFVARDNQSLLPGLAHMEVYATP